MASKLKSWEKFSYEAKKFLVDLVVALGTVGLLLPKGTYSVLKVFGKRAIGLKALLTSAGKKIIAAAKLLGRKPETAKVLNVSDLKKKMKTKERKREFKKTKSGRRNYLWFVSGTLITTMVFIAPYYSFSWYRQLPSVDLIDDRILSCTKIYDRKMRLLYEICPDIRVEPITINQVPENVINSTLAVEDTEFYSHKGFRILSLLRAAKETFLKKNVQGGSTITQQLVKLSLLTPERTFSRKTKELVLSFLVERR